MPHRVRQLYLGLQQAGPDVGETNYDTYQARRTVPRQPALQRHLQGGRRALCRVARHRLRPLPCVAADGQDVDAGAAGPAQRQGGLCEEGG